MINVRHGSRISLRRRMPFEALGYRPSTSVASIHSCSYLSVLYVTISRFDHPLVYTNFPDTPITMYSSGSR